MLSYSPSLVQQQEAEPEIARQPVEVRAPVETAPIIMRKPPEPEPEPLDVTEPEPPASVSAPLQFPQTQSDGDEEGIKLDFTGLSDDVFLFKCPDSAVPVGNKNVRQIRVRFQNRLGIKKTKYFGTYPGAWYAEHVALSRELRHTSRWHALKQEIYNLYQGTTYDEINSNSESSLL